MRAPVFPPGRGPPRRQSIGPGIGAGQVPGLPLQVHDPGLFGDPVSPPRLFRRLRRFSPSRTQDELDAERIVAHYAETGCLVPFLRPRKERRLDAVLVVDRTASSFLWHAAANELFEVLTRSGSFRHVSRMDLEADGDLHRGGTTIDPRRLIDAEGRTLVLVATDAIAGLWYGGKGVELLDLWGRALPVVMIEWLPERQWGRTAIGAGRRRAVSSSPERPDQRTSPTGGRVRPARREGTSSTRPAIPVTTLDPVPLERWTRMLIQGDVAVPGILLPDRPPADEDSRPPDAMTVQQQVDRFDSLASPEARRLLRMLAGVPLKLAIIRLVHESLLPGTGPSVVAEVMLGGLIEQVDPGDPERARFAFRAGVSELLPDGASARDLFSALRTVATKLGVRFGGKSFDAAVRAPEEVLAGDPAITLDGDAGAFALAAAPVLKLLGGRYRRLGELLELRPLYDLL